MRKKNEAQRDKMQQNNKGSVAGKWLKLTFSHQLSNLLILRTRKLDIVDRHHNSEELFPCQFPSSYNPHCILTASPPSHHQVSCNQTLSMSLLQRQHGSEVKRNGKAQEEEESLTLASAAASQLIGMIAVVLGCFACV